MTSLKKYKSKRNLKTSKEPLAKVHKRKKGKLQFVVQKHAATRLHYDFRLEVEGVLKSWAVPKGPSLNPTDKRLAIMVEDHPYDYKDFEGIIPKGYGAGSVIIWDKGTYTVEDLPSREAEKKLSEGIQKGEIHFTLEGEKLQGEFALVRIRKEKNEWLLIKKKDASSSGRDVLELDQSVVSGATIDEIGKRKSQKKKASLQTSPPIEAPKKKMFHHIEPMLATLVDAPFNHEAWLFEIKLDGYRAIAEVSKKEVALYSRNFQSFNQRFPTIVKNLKSLQIEAIFDGEIVVLDEKGVSRFQLMQNVEHKAENLYYYIFDLLYYQGYDLRSIPLIQRKEILKGILSPLKNSHLRYNDHVENRGVDFFKTAIQHDLEGIVGKLKQGAYLSGKRTKEWVKIKRILKQEVIICGFTEPKGSRKNLGALVTGLHRNGELVFAGHVGGGFTEKRLQEMKKKLEPLIQTKSPFKAPPKTNTKVTWVKPHILCEVAFSEWTNENIMRQPIFLGIREDKKPKAITKEQPEKVEKILNQKPTQKSSFTNLDKLYWPKEKITKGEVIQYYERIHSYILPYLKDRPQSLKRFPEGIEGGSFYQKNLENSPNWIKTVKIAHKDKVVNYLLIQDLDSLLYAVNLGCIELHPFFSRYYSLEYPDFFVFDLDPEDISFDKVIETAQALHSVLESLDIPSYCKTSGATGLHICVPLQAKYTFDQAKEFAQILAYMTQQMVPEFTSLERIPKKRQKKVYIDCFQNNLGQTIAAPYSLRALKGAPVSTPLDWSEVVKGMRPLDFTMQNLFARLDKTGDLFKPVLKKGINIETILKKMRKLEIF